MLRWRKFGKVFNAEESAGWMASHAQNPVAIVLDGRCRVFFNSRPAPINGLYVSYPSYVDLSLTNLPEVINIAPQPLLQRGKLGCFDHHGCMSGSVVKNGDELWMYYVGWSRSVDVPYRWAIGLAISKDNGESFQRYSDGPIVTANIIEPYQLHNAPHVIKLSKNDWRMWYSCGTQWLVDGDKKESVYVIKSAYSNDGIHWQRTGDPLIPCVVENESQTSATVFEIDGLYHMLFSYRHSTDFRNAARGYRLGHATSKDLKTWVRCDEASHIPSSQEQWDSEMVCYPYVTKVSGKTTMFYCGNGFGKGGLGYAILDN